MEFSLEVGSRVCDTGGLALYSFCLVKGVDRSLMDTGITLTRFSRVLDGKCGCHLGHVACFVGGVLLVLVY